MRLGLGLNKGLRQGGSTPAAAGTRALKFNVAANSQYIPIVGF